MPILLRSVYAGKSRVSGKYPFAVTLPLKGFLLSRAGEEEGGEGEPLRIVSQDSPAMQESWWRCTTIPVST